MVTVAKHYPDRRPDRKPAAKLVPDHLNLKLDPVPETFDDNAQGSGLDPWHQPPLADHPELREGTAAVLRHPEVQAQIYEQVTEAAGGEPPPDGETGATGATGATGTYRR